MTNSTTHHDLPLGPLNACQICTSQDLNLILDLGHHAPCDSLLTREQTTEMERTYPLRFVRCRGCGLAQIDYVVPPEVLFYPGYPYRSGITETLKKNLTGMATKLVRDAGIKKDSLVIDLGSNDGTTLQGFKAEGMRVLGVEPTDIARIAIENGIPTLQVFFREALAKDIIETHGKAAIVTASNMFAHIPNLGDLIRGVRALMTDNGLFVTESHYLIDLLDTVQYDSIYHEHLKYYSLRTLLRLFRDYDFTVVDAERITNYGGSVRVYAMAGRGRRPQGRLQKLLEEEDRFMANPDDTYARFRERVLKSKDDLWTLLIDLKKQGKKTVGVGCPGRASTLINFCGIGPTLLPYIAEQSNSLKLGMFLPGKHIPVVDERIMFEENPDYTLVLSWHYFKPIVDKLRQKGLKSQFIIPLPDVHVLAD